MRAKKKIILQIQELIAKTKKEMKLLVKILLMKNFQFILNKQMKKMLLMNQIYSKKMNKNKSTWIQWIKKEIKNKENIERMMMNKVILIAFSQIQIQNQVQKDSFRFIQKIEITMN